MPGVAAVPSASGSTMPRRRRRSPSTRCPKLLRRPDRLTRDARVYRSGRDVFATLQWRVPRDSYIREKFTRDRTYARKLAAEYFERFPKDRYRTEVESWRELQWKNIEFT